MIEGGKGEGGGELERKRTGEVGGEGEGEREKAFFFSSVNCHHLVLFYSRNAVFLLFVYLF